jgi:serine/threonine protein kinase
MTSFAQRFVLEREIGAGGMARVFLGRDEVLERPVAVKILSPVHGGTNIADRFRREGRTAARLSHPNVVPVYDAGEAELEGREVSYIVMEYVPGGDLKALIDEGPLPSEKLARLGAEVSSGLAHAHERGVIHRDIKPHNILIDDYGRPKLTDFGIARALDATTATQTGSYLGTALYSSPEQLRGEKVTPKGDIYSLGVTLYQAAAGQVPFTGTPVEVASQHVSRVPTAPSVLGANLSDGVESLILDCLHKDPDLRPTAKEVHERLLDVAGDARPARAQTPPQPVERSGAGMSEDPPASPTSEGTRADTRVSPSKTVSTGAVSGGVRGEAGRSRRRGPVLLAAAALLLVALGVAAFATLGDGENKQASSSKDEGQYAASAGGEEPAPAQGQTAQGQTPSDQEGNDEEDAAAQAVVDYYTAAADGDYDKAWNLLSSGYRQQLGSREAYTGQFDTLESIDFVEGPQAQVSGNTATVTGVTTAVHTNRTERNRGTWTLVNENGEWKISGQTVNPAA